MWFTFVKGDAFYPKICSFQKKTSQFWGWVYLPTFARNKTWAMMMKTLVLTFHESSWLINDGILILAYEIIPI